MANPPKRTAAGHRKRYNRACQLVGHFMCQWTHLEYEISRSIHKILGLFHAEGSIVTSSLQVRDKISILRSLLEFHSRERMSDQWRSETNRFFTKLSDLIPDRNFVAHTYFEPTDDGSENEVEPTAPEKNMPVLDATLLDTDSEGCELLAAILGTKPGADETTQAFNGNPTLEHVQSARSSSGATALRWRA
jgi:hypothetical protein